MNNINNNMNNNNNDYHINQNYINNDMTNDYRNTKKKINKKKDIENQEVHDLSWDIIDVQVHKNHFLLFISFIIIFSPLHFRRYISSYIYFLISKTEINQY